MGKDSQTTLKKKKSLPFQKKLASDRFLVAGAEGDFKVGMSHFLSSNCLQY